MADIDDEMMDDGEPDMDPSSDETPQEKATPLKAVETSGSLSILGAGQPYRCRYDD